MVVRRRSSQNVLDDRLTDDKKFVTYLQAALYPPEVS
jgi:hypothetical protein